MTEINISYHTLNHNQLAQCQINIATNMVAELTQHFQRLFGKELAQAEISQKGERTSIIFQAPKAKIKALEKIIIAVKQMTARLN